MTNIEDLKSCFEGEHNEDVVGNVADWLMDFVYNIFGENISDAEATDYLLDKKDDQEES